MDKRISPFQIFKNESQLTKILCYPVYKVVNDPYEKTQTETFLNPIAIKGVVTPVSAESLRWKYYGQIPTGSKKVVIEKKHKTIIQTAGKIKIGNDYYKCYFDDERGFALREYNDYVVAVLEMKNI
jgi:hypothetical protein